MRHGAKLKRCSKVGCTNGAKKRGLCYRHGAYQNTNDESTAFGSEFEKTTATATLSLPNEFASRPPIIGQGGSVPDEVAIVCQEIVEV